MDKSRVKPRRRWVWIVGLLALVILLVVIGLYAQLRASLPLLEGTLTLNGLSAPVTIERDTLGVPDIQAENRLDASRALGFLHGQERFFQMDLLRRSAAGELAEIFGESALEYDQRIRLHRFRNRAQALRETLSATEYALMLAYTEGVNAGLQSLGQVPFEYTVLRNDPLPWRAEDIALVVFAMYLDLQDETARYEATLDTLYRYLPEPVAAFFTPSGTLWDAPLQGDPFLPAAPPPADIFDLRAQSQNLPLTTASLSSIPRPENIPLGSNNWAVSGRLTANGAALLANDMHLGLRVPNIWYRARLLYRDENGQTRHLIGVTLPGTPAVVAGSNGAIAWGFTNSYGDWSDRIVLEPVDAEHYLTSQGAQAYQHIRETIAVKDAEPVTLDILETRWGPVLPLEYAGQDRRYALSWVAHFPAAVDLGLMQLEHAANVAQALEIANQTGTPAQNIVVADKQGHIGWTIAGPMPRRVGFTGRLPVSWAGAAHWDGWLQPAEYPRIIDPPDGVIWTANARVVDGTELAKIGDGGYALGARAQQIRDKLIALDQADAAALLAIQLDDRAIFLQRWRKLLLNTLDEAALTASPQRQPLYDLVQNWNGRASVDAVGYRLVRAFREQIWALVFAPLQAYLQQYDPTFAYHLIKQSEGPLWQLLQARPLHYLHPDFPHWQALLLAAADQVISELGGDGGLAKRTWGERNTLRMQHPFSRVMPWLSNWLDMPAEPLPGGIHMPRVQGTRQGASQRMVIAPGFEQEGIFQMPGGQSGHPLSLFYRAGHAAWVEGESTPLLPGPAQYRLQLQP